MAFDNTTIEKAVMSRDQDSRLQVRVSELMSILIGEMPVELAVRVDDAAAFTVLLAKALEELKINSYRMFNGGGRILSTVLTFVSPASLYYDFDTTAPLETPTEIAVEKGYLQESYQVVI